MIVICWAGTKFPEYLCFKQEVQSQEYEADKYFRVQVFSFTIGNLYKVYAKM